MDFKPCKNPCPECPYRKSSTPGYLGGNDPKEYAKALHLDTVVPCHMRSEYDEDGTVDVVAVCPGHLMAQKRVCKRTEHPEAKAAWDQKAYEANRDDILGFDFYDHHGV